MGRPGKREFVRVLRLLETFPIHYLPLLADARRPGLWISTTAKDTLLPDGICPRSTPQAAASPGVAGWAASSREFVSGLLRCS